MEVSGSGAGAFYFVTVAPLLLSGQSARWLCGQSGSHLAPGTGGHGFGGLALEHPRAAAGFVSLAATFTRQLSSCWAAGYSRAPRPGGQYLRRMMLAEVPGGNLFRRPGAKLPQVTFKLMILLPPELPIT